MGALFDGEGCLFLETPTNSRRIIIANNNPEIISACFRFTGAGNIGTLSSAGNITYQWRLHRLAEIENFLQQIKPCSARAGEMLQNIHQR